MIKLSAKDPVRFTGDMLVYFLAETGKKSVPCREKAVCMAVKTAWKSGDFSGKSGQSYWFYPSSAKQFSASRVLVVGLGKNKDSEADCCEQLRLAAGTAVAVAAKLNVKTLMAVLPEKNQIAPSAIASSITEGLLLGNYVFDKYKTLQKNQDCTNEFPSEFFLHDGGLTHLQVRRGMNYGRRAALAACKARDMANEPGNSWTPAKFAEYGRELADKYALKCKVLNRQAMVKLGMGGILGVNQGSALPPKLVILHYLGNKKWPTLMLVGKGLTFDSGGISLKPATGMEDMKYDMCGGAAVFGAMQVIGSERPKGINVVALVPATENLSGAAAIKPGDIITHYGGTTSEVINTDAEGRLILADALAYGIDRYKPDAVVDLATLTGAVIVGLGHHRTGLMATDDKLASRLMQAGELAGEPLWRLPLGPEYSKQIESKVADIRNIGGKGGGTITAACYLQEFVGDTPWAHLDIAGTAWDFTEKSYVPKGPSGIAVRTLVNLVRNWKIS